MPNGSPKKTKSGHKDLPHLILGVILVLFGGFLIASTLFKGKQHAVVIRNQTIIVEVADDAEEQFRGLSGKEGLAEDAGMLFVLTEPHIPNFVMRDMNFALDFVWIKEDKTIAGITPSVNPDTYPAFFSPPEPVKYVLEVNAGIAERHGWQVGDGVALRLR